MRRVEEIGVCVAERGANYDSKNYVKVFEDFLRDKNVKLPTGKQDIPLKRTS